MKLSLLIPTLPKRAALLGRLQTQLWGQVLPYAGNVELLIDDSIYDTIGEKRNRLMQRVTGEYVASIDDDDRISENYIKLLMWGIGNGVDACSLRGIITFDGINPAYFEHSLLYRLYETKEDAVFENGDIKYLRFHNHINCIKSSIAKQFKFPEINHGEDTDFATQIHNSGLIKTEHYINEVIYHYDYIQNK